MFLFRIYRTQVYYIYGKFVVLHVVIDAYNVSYICEVF